jgi:hypothetical protein
MRSRPAPPPPRIPPASRERAIAERSSALQGLRIAIGLEPMPQPPEPAPEPDKEAKP